MPMTVDDLSIQPMYNAMLSKSIGIRTYPKIEEMGIFSWCLLRDEKTANGYLLLGYYGRKEIVQSKKYYGIGI